MQNRTTLLTVTLIVLAAVVGYAVCRKPDSGVSTVAPKAPLQTGEPPTSGAVTRPPPGGEAAEAALQSVIDKLIAKWNEIDAVSVSFKTRLPEAAGSPGSTLGTGKFDYVKIDAGIRIWYWMFNELWFDQEGGKKILTAENLISVYDGEFLYQQVAQYEFLQTTKTRYHPDKILQIGGVELFRRLRELNTLRPVGEETLTGSLIPKETEAPEETKGLEGRQTAGDVGFLEGMETYVIEATPKDGDWKETHWFDKETGIRVRLLQTGKEETPALLLEVIGIDLDPKFDDDHFVYKLPEGAELIDRTKDEP